MKRTGTIRKVATMTCLGMYLLVALGISDTRVWCVGADGHQAYESIHIVDVPCDSALILGSSSDPQSSSDQSMAQKIAVFTPTWVSGVAGTCVDTQVSFSLWRQLDALDLVIAKPLAVMLYQVDATSPMRYLQRSNHQGRSTSDQLILDALNSIILLV